MNLMRIALVSPYSWTYPGGVTRHIDALAREFIAAGHHVRVLAPYDPPDRFSAVLHRGARPQTLNAPDYLVPLGRTVGFKANGAVSNLSITPHGIAALHRELRTGGYDVAHIHEPVAPLTGWVATDWTRLPLVGTFHSYSPKRLPNGIANLIGARRVLNRLHVRIAVSEAAAWTGRRWFGGHYRVIPNGVHVDPERARAAAARPHDETLRIAFVGQAVPRKGLPLLLRAFEALREHIPCELTVIGPTADELSPLLVDPRGVTALGKVDEATKQGVLEAADVLAAPSLGGESFGMVLTEAFAAGTPVIASDIAGYRDVVRDGVDGLLVPVGDAQALAEALRDLYDEPERRTAMAQAAAVDVERFAWPRVAAEVLEAYDDAIAVPRPEAKLHRAAVRVGARPADLRPHVRARRLPTLEPALSASGRPWVAAVRRIGLLVVSLGGIVLAWLALQKIGIGNIVSALVNSSPTFVLLGLAVMCSAMAMRAVSWHAILQAALPRARIRLGDAMQGTFIGVLMSSTLPARLGEPSRALVVARRSGRPRENLPIVLGTLVSQTLLNLVALAILGAVMFSLGQHLQRPPDGAADHGRRPAGAAVHRAGGAGHPAGRGRAPARVALLARQRGARPRPPGPDPGPGRAGRVPAPEARRDRRRSRSSPRGRCSGSPATCCSWRSGSISRRASGPPPRCCSRSTSPRSCRPRRRTSGSSRPPAPPCCTPAGTSASPSGVAYGVILQAVEVVTAILMGMPALLKEGMSWREVRLRAMHATPVKLPARGQKPRGGRGGESAGTAPLTRVTSRAGG